jgi:predicted dehydrogenase/nucleoside-diphosphate-sugar epimerase
MLISPATTAEGPGARSADARGQHGELHAAAKAAPRAVGSPVRVAIVGTGFIADYHAEALREIGGVELTAACDPHAGRLKEFGARWNVPELFPSIDALIASQRVDVAHVLVPPALHVQAAKPILAAGIHVLLEKPMALSSADARELARTAASRPALLGVNHNWLHHPLFRRALEDIAQRKIGPVRHVTSTNSLPLFQLSAGLHDHWMFEEPTNILYEQGVHPLSQISRLVGEARSVTGKRQDARRLRGGKPFYANWQFAIEGERASAQMFLAFGGIFPDVQLHIIGQDGAIHIDQLNDLYTLDRRTRFIDAGDKFVRGRRRARAIARDAWRGLVGYGLSLVRITGRKDAYYVGMRDSIAEYYQALCDRAAETASGNNGLQTAATLDKMVACFEYDAASPAVALRAPARGPDTPPAAVECGAAVVFGAGGFIGRKVVERLAAAGVPQRLVVRNPKRIADIEIGPALEVFAGDVTDSRQVDQAVAGCETIIHLVAGAPTTWAGYQKLFVDGLRNVAESALAHGTKRLLFASSITSLYLGRRDDVITEATPPDDQPGKRCEYAKAKILCEQLLLDLHAKRGLPAVILRPGIVIGPGSPVQHLGLGVWPSETACVRWGRDIDRGLPLVLVDDVAEAFLCAMRADIRQLAGKAFNLVGDVRLSAREYIDALRRESERDFRLYPQSVAFWTGLELAKWAIKAAAFKPENSRLSWREVAYRTGAAAFDCRGTKAALGWQPEVDREEFILKGLVAALRSYE